MSRHDASLALKRNLQQRFGPECANCGEQDALAFDVAHLFEDATARRSARSERLIILCPTCNQAEDRAKRPSMPALWGRFEPNRILVRARCLYREGKYSSAYQSSRLAAYLFERQRNYSKAVECLIYAISALRPIRWGDYLVSTLLEVERLCRSHKIGLVQRWLCLDRFSLVLYDYRRWQESAEIQRASAKLGSKVTNDERYPDDLRFDQANAFRRGSLIEFSTGRLTRKSVRVCLDRLLDDAREFKRQGQFDGYAKNLDVSRKLTLELLENPAEAHGYSQRALECRAKISHWWVLQEHYWSEADFYHSKNDQHQTEKSVVAALQEFHRHPVALEPTLGPQGPIPHDPIANLSRYGIEVGRLRELGVSPSNNPPPELALQLSRRNLDRIVANLMRDPRTL